jgi:hypothetical protein
VRLTEETQFVRDGQPVQRDEVKPGAEVRAAYEPRGDLAYATQVELLSAGQDAAGPSGSSGGQDSAGPSGSSGAQDAPGSGGNPGGQDAAGGQGATTK